MRNHLALWILAFGALSPHADADELRLTKDKVVPLSRLLEDDPLNKQAPALRALFLRWEEESPDVVDVVCPSMFHDLPKRSTPYGDVLLVQFLVGSAAYQIANPDEKGKLLPQQIAGVRSMVKTYRTLKAKSKHLNIPVLEDYLRHESAGTFDEHVKSEVSSACTPKADAQ